MTALTAGSKPQPIPGPRSAQGYQRVTTNGTTFYEGGISAFDPATGFWVKPDGTKSSIVCTGVNRLGDLDHLVGDGVTEMLVDSGTYLFTSSGLTTANEGAIAYCNDDQTFSLAPGAAAILGIIIQVVSATQAYVLVDPIVNMTLAATSSTSARKCRGVFGNSVPVYTGSKTAVLTVTATGALGSEDGLTPGAGEVWFWQEGSTNLTDPADAGPWLIVNPGATGVQPVLTRPSWWSHGSPIVPSSSIDIGPEGTGFTPQYANVRYKSWAAPGNVVGANAPSFWPVEQSYAVTLASGTLASAIRTLPVRDTISHGVAFTITSDPATAPNASTKLWRISALMKGVTNTASVQMVAESAPGTTNSSDVGQYLITVINGG